ncbi:MULTISPECIES: AAA family ATPase [Acinetobacter]|uniref:AAA family ATPase n=1 Tax=Acinetobacter TaxID=469 RepID=UPI0002AEB907|nr:MULTISPECIES: AAA family ATPase [Acinetobacter]ELW77022.1 VirC1 protein [Acinetobacter sp. WC-743]MBJ8428136.1 AAA family ATPase [Acinetobacter bereziniae]
MSIFVVANQKGGVGKTTLATNLAVALSKKGKTILVDGDDQQSSFRWNSRREDKIDTVHLKDNLKEELLKLNETYDYVIVDVAGKDGVEFRSALVVADKLVIPTQPSQTDIEVLPFVLKLVAIAKQNNPKLETFVVLNKAPSNSKSTEVEAAHELLNTIKSVKTLKTIIRDRKQFRDAMIDGLSVLEMNSSKAKDEFNDFLVEII